MRILLVDDEPQIVQAMARILRARRGDWNVRTATSGSAALLLLAAEPADIVISDMRMPGMDGVTFLSEVKSTWPAAIRIVLSGQGTQDCIERVGMVTDRVLAKPVTTSSLLATLESAIEANRGNDAVAPANVTEP